MTMYAKAFREHLVNKANGACHYCGSQLTDRAIHIDHVYPKSWGGTDELDNLVATCQSCNKKKGARDPDAWRQSLPKKATSLLKKAWEEIIVLESKYGLSSDAVDEIQDSFQLIFTNLNESDYVFHFEKPSERACEENSK